MHSSEFHLFVSALQRVVLTCELSPRERLLDDLQAIATIIPTPSTPLEALSIDSLLRRTLASMWRAAGALDLISSVGPEAQLDRATFLQHLDEVRQVLTSRDVPRLVKEIERLLKHHFAEQGLRAEWIGRRLHVSPSHITRVLTRHTSHGLRWHIRALRIERAKVLLQEADLSIKQIAAEVGYASASEFDKQFRRACRITPSAWRLQHAALRDSAAEGRSRHR
jgi:AraC-like DNA-binding protein